MGKEQISISIMELDRVLDNASIKFYGSFVVPRRTIAQLIDVSISAVDQTEADTADDANYTTAAGLIKGASRADETFLQENWGNYRTIVADLMTVKRVGAPTAFVTSAKIRIHEDFIDGDPRVRINNRSGPHTNVASGYQFFMVAVGDDATRASLIGTMTIELDWPASRSSAWKREHIANEENQ